MVAANLHIDARGNHLRIGSTKASIGAMPDQDPKPATPQEEPSEEGAAPPARSTAARSTEDRERALRHNRWLLWGTLIFVAILSGRAIYKSFVATERGTLTVPELSQERVELPPELARRGLPLESLREALLGSRLDKPRAHIALYGQGRSLGEAWGEGPGLKAALTSAWEATDAAARKRASHAMIVVPTNRRAVNPNAIERTFSNVHKGVLGVLVESEADTFLLSPLRSIVSNRSVVEELKSEARHRGIEYREWIKGARVFSINARQFYVPLTGEALATETLRGNVLIKTGEVSQESVTRFEQLLTDWLFNNLESNGRLTYIYYPSTGHESRGNNMIRQWMGSVAMGRAARIHQDEARAQASYKNIRYNLQQFYRTQGELGYIDYENEAKLGAAALALIALVESSQRAEFAEYERGLLATTKHLWQPSGRFHTFLKPEGRNDENHNFYPGETLLAWSFLYAENEDQELLDMSLKSFAHYKTWHLQNRNPAFIPWHTQAYYQLYQKTQNAALKDWIFEMNDWLVDVMQTNSRVAYDDTIGRFYDSTSNRYGVPHASSTGVYLEGLIDAFTLARSVGDKAHEEKYRKAIILGLRSGMQLQFQDEIDMFYAADKNRLRGGMRTAVYNNEIRVDNVQHILMGVQKILKQFSKEDFTYPSPRP